MTEDEARVKVGGLLQHLREMRNMSQEDMADVLQIPRSAVSLIETGDRGIDFTELIEFSKLFKKHLDELVKPAMKKAEGTAKPFNTVRFSLMSENQTPEVLEAAQLYAPISAVTEAVTALGIGYADVQTHSVLQQQTEASSLCRAVIQIELPMNSEHNRNCMNTLMDNISQEYPASQPSIEMDVNGMLGLHALSFLTMNN